MTSQIHWIPATLIEKLGRVPVSYSSKKTCPAECPFFPKEGTTPCFAWANFRVNKILRRIEKDPTKARTFKKAMTESLRSAKIVRHFISGDVIGQEDEIYNICVSVEEEYNMTNIGYTHSWRRVASQRFKRFFRASCETLQDVVEASNNGWTTELTVSEYTDKVAEDIRSVGLVPTHCPEQATNGKVTCNECRLCSTAEHNQRRVIVFHSHKNTNQVNKIVQY